MNLCGGKRDKYMYVHMCMCMCSRTAKPKRGQRSCACLYLLLLLLQLQSLQCRSGAERMRRSKRAASEELMIATAQQQRRRRKVLRGRPSVTLSQSQLPSLFAESITSLEKKQQRGHANKRGMSQAEPRRAARLLRCAALCSACLALGKSQLLE